MSHREFSDLFLIKPLHSILGVLLLTLLGAAELSKESFLFCLKKDVNPLIISKNKKSVDVNYDQLNKFIDSKNIINIESWIPGATDIDRDGDIYLNRIYRAYVSPNRANDIPLLINEIEKLSYILYAEFEYIRKPHYTTNDPLSELQCTISSVKAEKAWDFWNIEGGIIPDGQNVLLASVDTGVDYTHPDLQNNSWINQGEIPLWMFEAGIDTDLDSYISAKEVVDFLTSEGMDINADGQINLRDAVSDGSPFEDSVDNDNNGFADDLLGWDCSGWYGPDDNDPFPKEDVDPSGTWAHGTHVAGLLAATTDNELGMASTSFNAKFISVKVSRENQTGDEPGISDGYAGITYAAKAGMYAGSFSIINNSWGGGGYSASENTVINNAQNTYGAIILSSAGNGSDSGGEVYETGYPASYENCISVCAIGCSYSWGNWASYHPTVDLAAPGESIYSTVIGSGYDSWDGSSMASPNAASAIGLLSAYHPDWDNMQLRSRIEESADRKIYEVNPEYETCNGSSGEDCLGSGMVDVYKAIGMDFSPSLSLNSIEVNIAGDTDLTTLIDNDNVLNPGETADLVIYLENEIGWENAASIIAILETDNPNVTIINSNGVYGNIANNNSASATFQFSVDPLISLGDIEFDLNVSGFGTEGYQYSEILSIVTEVSLHQDGFPYDTNSELKAAPVIIDLDNDGDNEIVIADYFGMVRVIDNGIEIENDYFPYDTGDQIWGSISSADLDGDNYEDFVISSKSGHLYIFDINGLKVDYNAGRWLIATPVIGNIDEDSDLEIVVGGYENPTSSSPLFAINHDGSPVDGFPYVLGEKMKSGVALADIDNNGIDDMIFGTDGDNLYVLLDNLTIAEGFPIDLGSNLRSEPAVLNTGDEQIILIGCANNNFYGINEDGSLRFVIPTGDDIYTSPSFYENSTGIEIYFGSDDGNIYGLDINGNNLIGFPLSVSSGAIVGSVVFSDLNSDGDIDMIVADDSGKIHGLRNFDGQIIQGFPINHSFPFSSSPQIVDYDNDGDLEVIVGSAGDLVNIDIKYQVENDINYWQIYKGDYLRSGYYLAGQSSGCGGAELGDINYDSIINILDIVMLVNSIIGSLEFSDLENCAADLNSDDILNVLDIVELVNLVING